MPFQATSPVAVAEIAPGASSVDHEAVAPLPAPATVRFDRVIWIYVITVAIIHLGALAAFIPWLFSWTGLALAILGVPFYGMGITLGYHRLLAHRSLVVAQVARARFRHSGPVLACKTRPPSG